VFWGVFVTSALMAFSQAIWPEYAEKLLGAPMIEQLETSFENPLDGRNPEEDFVHAAFYIQHNTSIGLRCFVGGLLVIPGLLTTMFNAAHLGAAFGYMARPTVSEWPNFLQFVTAHGPFELNAIVLSAGAGLRLGMSWLIPGRLGRIASLRKNAVETMPVMGAAMCLFFLAALVEGFVSPSGLPYAVKGTVAVVSSGLLMFYFVILGMSGRSLDAAG
jgi:uncharacterized membrane protein SpoIIM required for sporulation